LDEVTAAGGYSVNVMLSAAVSYLSAADGLLFHAMREGIRPTVEFMVFSENQAGAERTIDH
jgi:hypothetical protein